MHNTNYITQRRKENGGTQKIRKEVKMLKCSDHTWQGELFKSGTLITDIAAQLPCPSSCHFDASWMVPTNNMSNI